MMQKIVQIFSANCAVENFSSEKYIWEKRCSYKFCTSTYDLSFTEQKSLRNRLVLQSLSVLSSGC